MLCGECAKGERKSERRFSMREVVSRMDDEFGTTLVFPVWRRYSIFFAISFPFSLYFLFAHCDRKNGVKQAKKRAHKKTSVRALSSVTIFRVIFAIYIGRQEVRLRLVFDLLFSPLSLFSLSLFLLRCFLRKWVKKCKKSDFSEAALTRLGLTEMNENSSEEEKK